MQAWFRLRYHDACLCLIVVKIFRKTIKSNPDISINLKMMWLPTFIQHEVQPAVSSPAWPIVAAIAASTSNEKWPMQTRREEPSFLCECTATTTISLVGRTDMTGVGCTVCFLGKQFQRFLLLFLPFSFHLWTPEMHALLTQIPGNHVEFLRLVQ